MTRYTGVNCSKCGRWVGKDGFLDGGCDSDGIYELGYSLCKRCLDAQEPTIYDLEVEIRELKKSDTTAAKERITLLENQIEARRVRRHNASGAASKYKTMPLEDICALPVADIAEKKAM